MDSDRVKVLVVDDYSDILFVMEEYLSVIKKDGFDMLRANSAAEAFSLLEKHDDVALIFMDIMMPEMDGMEATHIMREEHNYDHIPVVFLTAKTDGPTQQEAKELGSDFVEKPFDIEEIKLVLLKHNLL